MAAVRYIKITDLAPDGFECDINGQLVPVVLETVTNLTFDSLTNIITFTNEDGTDSTVDLTPYLTQIGVTSTEAIALTLTGDAVAGWALTSSLILDPNPDNIAQITPDGLLVECCPLPPRIFDVRGETMVNETFSGIHNPVDFDLDGSIVNYSFTVQPPVSEGVFVFTDAAAGEFDFVPAANFVGESCVTVVATDDIGLTDDAIYCVTVNPLSIVRMSTLDDSDLRNVEITPAGSTDCAGATITDFASYKVTHPIYLSGGNQVMTDVVNLTETDNVRAIGVNSDSYTNAGLLLFEIVISAGVMSFDWSSTGFSVIPSDRANIESVFSLISAASASVAFDKYVLDTFMKGSNYAENCDYSNTNNIGVNYLHQDLGLTHIFDVDGTPHMEGAFLVLKEATLEDVSAICAGAVSLPETTEYIAKKGIKRVKHSFTNYSTGNVGLLDNFITASINRPNTRDGFNSQCAVPSRYSVNGGSNDASSDNGGADWWRLSTANTTIEMQFPAPYNVTQNNWSGDNPVMPTDLPAPTGIYYTELTSERVNGMDSNKSAYYETPRVSGAANGSRTSNPVGVTNVSGASVLSNYQRLGMQFSISTSTVAHVYANEGDNYLLKILDYQLSLINQNGVRIANWTPSGAGGTTFTNTAGDLKAYNNGLFVPPQFMNISEIMNINITSDMDYNGALPNPVLTDVDLQIVETF